MNIYWIYCLPATFQITSEFLQYYLRTVFSSVSHRYEKLRLRQALKGCMPLSFHVRPARQSVPLQWVSLLVVPRPHLHIFITSLEQGQRICSSASLVRGRSRSRGQTFLGNRWNNWRYRTSVQESPRQAKIWLNNWMEAKLRPISQGHRRLLGWFVSTG